ncbi:MAG TPA: SpoIID/LytB domain-containing protein [Bacteroidales bacterium]|jgi:stage II sporulation protein D|nr:SpoIID/LytB domain-containing protein [Bacteroidales bacterium]HQH24533.1 SpoIID/LytB domain-containing protein [Bacteroidales bacterium]HQJ83417.1 SpoIID/LytB domain-containing protein [Bacteroidales bacterium]
MKLLFYKYYLLAIVLTCLPAFCDGMPPEARLKVRLLSGFNTDSVSFSVVKGAYGMNCFPSGSALLEKGQSAVLFRSGEKLVIKTGNNPFWIVSDSVMLEGRDGNDSFTLSPGEQGQLTRQYSGELLCKADLGTLLLIGSCDEDTYIAGVVKAEGGSGRHREYFKVQAVIARTYMYRHLYRHAPDGFSLCDDVHCQAFNGITDDSLIIRAVDETRNLVITGPDSQPIISAFHSNCGGETLPSEHLWLTAQPYLKKVRDPYCAASPNSEWRKSIPAKEWIEYLGRSGMPARPADPAVLNFNQPVRMISYRAGNFSLPFVQIRSDLGLRSSFFSVRLEGDTVILSGRGYGHGAGLCQEGAMVMASRGFDFRKIIAFYYSGVSVTEIRTVSAGTE